MIGRIQADPAAAAAAAARRADHRRAVTGIASLSESDRAAVQGHLLRLSLQDRHLRFASTLSDEALVALARTLPLTGSLGLFLDGELVGMAHLQPVIPGEIEFGVSVESRARRCGWGRALLHASLQSCHAGGARQLTAYYDADNRPMARMMRSVQGAACAAGRDVVAHVGLEQWADELCASNRLIEPAV